MSEGLQSLTLPRKMDAGVAVQLMQDLLVHKGRAISVDASYVQQMSTLCVQVLLSARKFWVRNGLEFDVRNPSPAFRESTTLLGADALLF